MMKSEEIVFVTIPMSRELDIRARQQAAKLRVSRSEVLRRCAAGWLTQMEKETENLEQKKNDNSSL